jgi:hypothetical protein
MGMDYLKTIDLVIAGRDARGRAAFLDPPKAATHCVPGAVQAAYLWGTDKPVAMPGAIGGGVTSVAFPPVGGTRFGLICFPPRSAGKLDMNTHRGADNADLGDAPGMHRSDTVDYEIILSGKIDIVLEGGARRTLGPGSCLVMGGVMHAWENTYDEPCIYAVVAIGASGEEDHD